MNPIDNLANLPSDYLAELDALPEKQRAALHVRPMDVRAR